MSDAASCVVAHPLLEASIAIWRRAPHDPGQAAMTRSRTQTEARAPSAEWVASRVVRLAAAGAIAANASFPLIEAWRIAAAGVGGSVRYAVIATAATLMLHLRHVVLGLRNERPRSM